MNAAEEPAEYGISGDYWDCSYVKIEGGAAVMQSYQPRFVNDLQQFSSEGCRAATNDVGVCPSSSCSFEESFYRVPKDFENGAVPPTIPSSFYNYNASASVDPYLQNHGQIMKMRMVEMERKKKKAKMVRMKVRRTMRVAMARKKRKKRKKKVRKRMKAKKGKTKTKIKMKPDFSLRASPRCKKGNKCSVQTQVASQETVFLLSRKIAVLL